MARRIVWSPLAQEKRKEILNFWNENNQSKAYSRKLNQHFKKVLELISEFPHLGRPTDIPNVRMKTAGHYLIFYQMTKHDLEVLTLWDSRQDPELLKKELPRI